MLLRYLISPLLLLALISPSQAAHREMAAYQHLGYEETPLTFVKKGRRLVIPARVNNHATHLFLDTGGSRTVIDPHMLEALNLEFIRTGKRYSGGHLNGTQILNVNIRTLAVGQLTSENFHAITAPVDWQADAKNDRTGFTEAGSLGADFLREHNAILDLQRGSLYLRTDERASDFTRNTLVRQGWTAIHLQAGREDRLIAPATVRGKKGCFVIDTGAPYSLLNRSAARRLKVPLAKAKIKLHGLYVEDTGATTGTLEGLQVDTYAATPFQVAVSKAWESYIPAMDGATPSLGLLGIDFLILNQAIIDYPSQMLYLKHLAK